MCIFYQKWILAFKVVVNRPLMRIIIDKRFSGDFGRICVALRETIEYTLYIYINIDMGGCLGGGDCYWTRKRNNVYVEMDKIFIVCIVIPDSNT